MAKLTLAMKSGAVLSIDVVDGHHHDEAAKIRAAMESGTDDVISARSNSGKRVIAIRASEVDALYFLEE